LFDQLAAGGWSAAITSKVAVAIVGAAPVPATTIDVSVAVTDVTVPVPAAALTSVDPTRFKNCPSVMVPATRSVGPDVSVIALTVGFG
jgi:hypothetical protein